MPRSTGSAPAVNTIGTVAVAALAASAAGGAIAMITAAYQFGSQRRKSLKATIGRQIFDRDIAAFDIAELLEALPDRAELAIIEVGAGQQTDQRYCSLLRARRERPRGRGAADERDELAPFHQQFIPCFEAEDSIAGDLLHCGISKEPLSTMGHSVIAAKRRFVRQKRSFTPPSASPQDRSSVMYGCLPGPTGVAAFSSRVHAAGGHHSSCDRATRTGDGSRSVFPQ
jgi:hypothetical protein